MEMEKKKKKKNFKTGITEAHRTHVGYLELPNNKHKNKNEIVATRKKYQGYLPTTQPQPPPPEGFATEQQITSLSTGWNFRNNYTRRFQQTSRNGNRNGTEPKREPEP